MIFGKNNVKNNDAHGNSYGGYKYRFRYDDYCEKVQKKSRRSVSRETKYFIVTASCVFVACVSLLGIAVFTEDNLRKTKNTDVHTSVSVCNGGEYDSAEIGNFICESVSGEAIEKYRLPQGIVITYVNPYSEYHYNDDKMMSGDIITAIDGTDITCVDDFKSVIKTFDSGHLVTLGVYREGSFLDVSYVVN